MLTAVFTVLYYPECFQGETSLLIVDSVVFIGKITFLMEAKSANGHVFEISAPRRSKVIPSPPLLCSAFCIGKMSAALLPVMSELTKPNVRMNLKWGNW